VSTLWSASPPRALCNAALSLSLSSSSIPGASEADAEFLHQYMELVGRHPNQFSYHGRALVTTFAGDQCKFGRTSISSGWAVARAALERVCPVSQQLISRESGNPLRAHEFQIHLIPAFFIDPAQYPVLNCIDGIFHVMSAFI
jgi:glucan endo-1,3-alpha-glucosidase